VSDSPPREYRREPEAENAHLRQVLGIRLNEAVGLHRQIAEFRADNTRLRKALKQIAETDPEVGDRGGVCAYCDSRLIARRALKERGEE